MSRNHREPEEFLKLIGPDFPKKLRGVKIPCLPPCCVCAWLDVCWPVVVRSMTTAENINIYDVCMSLSISGYYMT